MNIQYVTLTCDNYFSTRCQWQKDTWLKQIQHHVFLGCQTRPEWNMVGWNTGDDYESCPPKLMNFVRHYSTDADWIVFADDDTFIFPQRLEAYLSTFDKSQPLYIGRLGYDGWEFMSGGAGFIVSNPLFKKIKEYTNTTSDKNLLVSRYSDLSFGHWAKNCNAIYKPSLGFYADCRPEYANDCISCHYLKQNDFYDMQKFLNLQPVKEIATLDI
jgi:hypothetical protein